MRTSEEIKNDVRNHYTAVVNTPQSCCGSACGCSADFTMAESYAGREGYVAEADLALGCGIPTDIADIRPGQTVVDLGSGAGNDCFVARQLVGDTGRVIGLDFTPAMIRKARENAAKLGFGNVEFVRGEIEHMPLADGIADVVVSNCVLNLVPDKRVAFAEMYRIIRPGGRFAVSDIVLHGSMAPEIKDVAALYAGCISGAIDQEEYLAWLRDAGFRDVEVRKERPYDLTDEFLASYVTPEEIRAFRTSNASIVSITVSGKKV
jgi:SAM-dependent methyltransferase